jgi:hypothetical protein
MTGRLRAAKRRRCGFRYSPDRKGEHPHKHLENFSGILQADAYGAWGKLYDSRRVTEAACWARTRGDRGGNCT